MQELLPIIMDIGLGASALYLARSLNRTVKSLTVTINDHAARLKALEDKEQRDR